MIFPVGKTSGMCAIFINVNVAIRNRQAGASRKKHLKASECWNPTKCFSTFISAQSHIFQKGIPM